ncbi:uncharacterized protein DUF1236 [Mesorhizobium sp. J18]|uniref:DUF1236 domain-containing protein n=1 Tax=Mesorhizobium sp. J18 TaxID=935263 RepID=UPI001198EB3D|nr:DUF1236 domain-containing protein [Mesorhizobium sp. J18]TWG91284.1 uncharacterized protein DUF1236 [Mesorhizobium sp. J18]
MKAYLYGAAIALPMLAGAGLANAQTVIVSPEQETVIREYVIQHEAPVVQMPADTQLSIGATLPADVELQVIEVPEVQPEYRYVVIDGRTYLVQPDTREIVHIIE